MLVLLLCLLGPGVNGLAIQAGVGYPPERPVGVSLGGVPDGGMGELMQQYLPGLLEVGNLSGVQDDPDPLLVELERDAEVAPGDGRVPDAEVHGGDPGEVLGHLGHEIAPVGGPLGLGQEVLGTLEMLLLVVLGTVAGAVVSTIGTVVLVVLVGKVWEKAEEKAEEDVAHV